LIKGFFFDLDGTLVDTHQANYQAYSRALADFGVEIDFEDFKKTIGQQFRTFIPQLAPGLDPVEYDGVAQAKATYYKDFLHLSRLNERLVRFLRQIESEHQVVLVTTAKRENAQAVLRYHGLDDAFDVVVAAQDVANSKPSPEAYELALQKTGLKPNQVIAFEDSEAGQYSAEAAKIAVIRVSDFSL
jgi:beta-phosphoglucomutase